MLADGGEAIADLAVLRDQSEVFGPGAPTPAAWRLLAAVDERVLDRLRSARARELARLQASETRCGIPAAKAGGREVPGLVLDIDATLITCHSGNEQAEPACAAGADLLGQSPIASGSRGLGTLISGSGEEGRGQGVELIGDSEQRMRQHRPIDRAPHHMSMPTRYHAPTR
ncbi:hypothetical protein [Streptomyces sp. IBSBF 2390]|uniref:hypothetical protein n=1 Tax=Streptomyces sp. IBSBF 2390 TaxID=2903533 RepID=UPI003FA7B1B6